jgi:hypothetical protein
MTNHMEKADDKYGSHPSFKQGQSGNESYQKA